MKIDMEDVYTQLGVPSDASLATPEDLSKVEFASAIIITMIQFSGDLSVDVMLATLKSITDIAFNENEKIKRSIN